MATLSDEAAALFDYLPSSYGSDRDDADPIVARWLEALAYEVARFRALLEALRATTIPATADDTIGALSRWEAVMRLPVAPPDATVAQRRASLLGALRGRRVARGIDWTNALTTFMGTDAWTVQENTPAPNNITVSIPFSVTSDIAGQVAAYVREITPANQVIAMVYSDGGFLVGESHVGDVV